MPLEYLQGLFGDWLRIALVQIEIPFNKDLIEKTAEDGTPIFKWKTIQPTREKILKIANSLLKKEPKLNLIVFPEYSIPSEILDELITFSNENKIAIIAGSHFCEDNKSNDYKKNICPIIYPNNKIYFAKKTILSEFEQNKVIPASQAGYEFYWKVQNKEVSLQVLLCSDYLSTAWGESKIDSSRPGLIIVPMCSNNIEEFCKLAQVHLRVPSGKFVALCNATGGMFWGSLAKGGTSLFGSTPMAKSGPFAVIDNDEGVLVCSLYLLNPKMIRNKPKTLPPETGIPIAEDILKYRIQQDKNNNWELIYQEKIDNTIGIINPNLLSNENKKLRLTLYKVLNYPRTKKILKIHDITSYAVFGDYDILCKTFEKETLPRKLKNTVFPELIETSQFFSVNKILWWEGHLLNTMCEFDESFLSYDEDASMIQSYELDDTQIEYLNRLIDDFNSKDIDISIKQKFLDDNILLGSKTKFGREINIKCFIYVGFPGIENFNQLKGIEENMMDRLCQHKNLIRGVYAGVASPIPWNYAIEAEVKDFHTLKDLTLTLHDIHHKFGIGVRTRTYPVVEIINEKNIQLSRQKIDEAELEKYFIGFTEDLKEPLAKFLLSLTESEKNRFKDKNMFPLVKRIKIISNYDALVSCQLDTVLNENIGFELSNARKSFIQAMISKSHLDYCNSISS